MMLTGIASATTSVPRANQTPATSTSATVIRKNHGETNNGRDRRRGQERNKDQRPSPQMQEQHQDDDGQRSAQDDVLLNQPDRRVDVHRFVVNLAQHQILTFQYTSVQFFNFVLEPIHHVDHVGTRFLLDVDRDVGNTKSTHESTWFFETQLDVRDVANVNRFAAGIGNRLFGNLFDRSVLPQRSDDITTFAFGKISAGNVLVVLDQCLPQILQRQSASRQLFRVRR